MGLGELLEQVRSIYLGRFRDAIAEQESETECSVIIESPYFDSSIENMIGFSPLSFEWEQGRTHGFQFARSGMIVNKK